MYPTPCPSLTGLSALYVATGANLATSAWGANKRTEWLVGDPCTNPAWEGVTCTSTGAVGAYLDGAVDVVSLDLAEVRLAGSGGSYSAGTIPTQLGGLTGLTQSLKLQSNGLGGSLPTQLGRLTSLGEGAGGDAAEGFGLLLQQNSFNGAIPTELGGMSVSRVPTNICGYPHSTATPRTHCSHRSRIAHASPARSKNAHAILTDHYTTTPAMPTTPATIQMMAGSFRLEANSLTKSIPTALGVMSNMAGVFSLESNTLTGSIPTQLGTMSGLSVGFNLVGAAHALTGTIPTELTLLSLLTGTTAIDVSGDALTGCVPDGLAVRMGGATTGINLFPTPCPAFFGLVDLYKQVSHEATTFDLPVTVSLPSISAHTLLRLRQTHTQRNPPAYT